MIPAFTLLVLRLYVVLKTSVASMTSTDKITSLASMTSTAALASKIKKKQHELYIMSDFQARETLVASMTSTASAASMASSASFHQKITELDFSINHGTKVTYFVLIMWVGSSKTLDF